MRYDLDELFDRIEGKGGLGTPPDGNPGALPRQPGLFGPPPSGGAPVPADPPPRRSALELARLSIDAYDALLHGWMSELPIGAELVRFARKVLAAGRREAERVSTDRGDPDTRTVLEAAARVQREIHRLMGFLRFSPAPSPGRGFYVARCAPDHFILPALAAHFVRRFGPVPWAVIDERRDLSLVRPPETPPVIMSGPYPPLCADGGPLDHGGLKDPWGPLDPWEDLWRRYHRSVNIEARKNPGLQRQCMPQRYWKYLPEMAAPYLPGSPGPP